MNRTLHTMGWKSHSSCRALGSAMGTIATGPPKLPSRGLLHGLEEASSLSPHTHVQTLTHTHTLTLTLAYARTHTRTPTPTRTRTRTGTCTHAHVPVEELPPPSPTDCFCRGRNCTVALWLQLPQRWLIRTAPLQHSITQAGRGGTSLVLRGLV